MNRPHYRPLFASSSRRTALISSITSSQGRWKGELREMVSDFITLKADARDEPALAWVLQKAVHGLVNIDILGEMILRRVLAMLPCDVPHRSTPQQNA